MATRREELLERSLDYLLDHGVADLSLRPLAAAVGTSARLLVYHFGSRDGLLTAVMDEVRARLQSSFQAMSTQAARRRRSPLEAFWAWATTRERLRYLRLLFEVQVLALQRPAEFAPYLQRTSASWLTAIESALPASRRSPALATLCAAVVDGLLLELLATEDRPRTTAALGVFRTMLQRAKPA
jgi:AcrR family transcriptional regulator